MVGNEDGSIIVIAVLLLLLLSLVVIGGSRTSAVEVMIAANKKASERVFYLADGLANQAARIIENQKLLDAAAGTKVLKDSDGWDAGGLRKQDNVLDRDGNVIDISETGGWEGGVSYDWAPTAGAAGQTWPNIAGWGDADGDGVSDNPREATDVFEYLVVDKGVAVGGSLDTSSSSQLREYNLRGRVQSGSVNDEVSVGYRMRVAN
ncbi:MAG: hypothetical protein HGA96_00300 [Desulfobulbaceae bacterium]|nr:hypothetical protein [Desulfobulbaceae bacterium]